MAKDKPKEYHITILDEHMDMLREITAITRVSYRQTMNMLLEKEYNKIVKKGK